MQRDGVVTAPDGLRDLAEDLRRWLASGRAQASDGAFCAWRDADKGDLAFAYPEITGYALTWLAGRAHPTPAEQEAGRHACAWLVSRLERGNWSARDGWDDDAVYVFDLAMIATGLFAFGRSSQAARALAVGAEIVAEILRQQDAEYPLRSLSHRASTSTQRCAWSTDGYAHLIKVAQCLLVGGELGIAGASEGAAKLVDRAAEIQRVDGSFTTHLAKGPTMLHPHLYAIEGLWIYAEATGDATARERATRAMEWTWSKQLANGGFPRFSPGAEAPAQADLTAQAVRMSLLLGVGDGPGRERAYDWLENMASGDAGGRALHYQPGVSHLNTWATLFAAQALSLASGTTPTLDWRVLV
jgi:hypothetical protein